MSDAAVLDTPATERTPNAYLALDGRWGYIAAACVLWALVFWQVTGPVAAFRAETVRVRMPLPFALKMADGAVAKPIDVAIKIVEGGADEAETLATRAQST